MQVFFIHGTWDQFWGSLKFDAEHPPLDLLVCRLLEFANPADAVRKLPAVVWGAGSVVALGAFVARRAGRVAGYLSAVGLCFAPFHVRYSQELRPYSLAVFVFLLSLLALDRYLDRPGLSRLLLFFLGCVAAEYTLYLAAAVLAIAGSFLLIEDSFSAEPEQRKAARRFLLWSPLFCAALAAAYIPWWPVLRRALERPPVTSPPPMTFQRLGTVVSFFSFAPNEGHSLAGPGLAYVGFCLVGMGIALRRAKLRFLAGWFLAGVVLVEFLEHRHPHFFASRYFLLVGLALPVFASIALVTLARSNLLGAIGAAAMLALILASDVSGLAAYYRDGRPDWRPLGAYLRATPSKDRILAESQYVQLCAAYYVDGPAWLHAEPVQPRKILTVEGDPKKAQSYWEPGRTVWLLLFRGGIRSPELKEWAEPFPGVSFPTAEGGVVVKRLSR